MSYRTGITKSSLSRGGRGRISLTIVRQDEWIEHFRPPPAEENMPAAEGQLLQLNRYGLIGAAFERQLKRDASDPKPWKFTVIRKITAWETLAEAQRNGLKVTPLGWRDRLEQHDR